MKGYKCYHAIEIGINTELVIIFVNYLFYLDNKLFQKLFNFKNDSATNLWIVI